MHSVTNMAAIFSTFYSDSYSYEIMALLVFLSVINSLYMLDLDLRFRP